MANKHQKQRIREKLFADGFVSRNYFLDLPYDKITRMSHYIMLLRQEGLDIETKEDNKDTIYTLKNRPPKIVYEIIKDPPIDGGQFFALYAQNIFANQEAPKPSTILHKINFTSSG